MVEQNRLLCFLFSALGGAAAVAGEISLIIPHDHAKQNGVAVKEHVRIISSTMNILFQVASATFYTYAPMYGPVSLCRPAQLSSYLLTNLFVIGVVMKREKIEKENTVAACVIVLSVILLQVVGPGVQNNQDIMLLLLNPVALAWVSLLSLIHIVSDFFMFFGNIKVWSQRNVQVCLLGVSITASVLSVTFARAMSITSGGTRIVLIIVYIYLQIVWAYENFVDATAVHSRLNFLPVYAVGGLLCNALSGIIVWEDWEVMSSWIGYGCVFLLMILGILLMSDLKFTKNHVQEKTNNTDEQSECIDDSSNKESNKTGMGKEVDEGI